MGSLNKVQIIGTLGKDPEIRYSQNGTAFTNLSVATSDRWTDKATGERREKTEWHQVVIMGKIAEVANQYLVKGSKAYFEGKLQTRKWQDQNTGQDRYSTEIIVGIEGKMVMLGSPKNAQQPAQNPQPQAMGQAPEADIGEGSSNFDPDEYPF